MCISRLCTVGWRKYGFFPGIKRLRRKGFEDFGFDFPKFFSFMKKGSFLSEISREIVLNERERELKRVLLVVSEECGRRGRPVVLRFAGGWVRDKVFFGYLAGQERAYVSSCLALRAMIWTSSLIQCPDTNLHCV